MPKVERESAAPPKPCRDEKFSNQLSDGQLERLAILSEELGEAQQCIGKIIRHGYDSYNPLTKDSITNRTMLVKELGDVIFAINMLNQDVDGRAIGRRVIEKAEKIKPYLHHQGEVGNAG